MSQNISALVIAREHANLDSLPLRFGLHFSIDTEITIESVTDLGVDDRYDDRHHYEGHVRDPNKPSSEPLWGHFVIGYRSREKTWALVTAWRNGTRDDEYFLSNTLRNLREAGILTPQTLLAMHPDYIKGEINTSGSLIAYLSKHLAKEEIIEAKAAEDRSRMETEKAIAEMAKAKKEAEAAKIAAQHARSIAIEAIEVVESLEIRASNAEQSEKETKKLLADALAKIERNEKAQPPNNNDHTELASQPARAVTNVWDSKTGRDYKNVGIDALILNVTKVGANNIRLDYIGKEGSKMTVEDFGYYGFVIPVFEYLKSRVGRRAVFLVTQKKGGSVKLASDTMMLPMYKDLWS